MTPQSGKWPDWAARHTLEAGRVSSVLYQQACMALDLYFKWSHQVLQRRLVAPHEKWPELFSNPLMNIEINFGTLRNQRTGAPCINED